VYSVSYYNVSTTNLYVASQYKFDAWANDTFKQLAGGSNIVEKLKFTEYLDVCGDGDDDGCTTEGGSFDLAHSYNIPSTGNMDGFFEGFNVSSRLLFYSADAGSIMGDCEVLHTTKTLCQEKKTYDADDTDDLHYVADDTVSAYQCVTSQSSWYVKSIMCATVCFLGVYAGHKFMPSLDYAGQLNWRKMIGEKN